MENSAHPLQPGIPEPADALPVKAFAPLRRLTGHLAFWLALNAAIFIGFAFIAYFYYGGVGRLEHQYAFWMVNGLVPYVDFPTEYPPLALLSFLAPGLLFRELPGYYIAYAAELLLFDLLAVFLIARISQRLRISTARALAIYTVVVLAIGPILAARYDIIPAALALLALGFFVEGKNKSAWGVLGLAFMTKLYPVVLAPLFLLYQLSRRQYARALKGAMTFGVVVLVLGLPWLLLDASGFLNSFVYHLGRGLHSESTYGIALMVGKILGLTDYNALASSGSWNLFSPLADTLAQASFVVTEALLVLVFVLYFRKELAGGAKEAHLANALQPASGARLFRYSAAAVLAFVLANKVFSPQYLVWLCPLLPLLRGRWRAVSVVCFLIAGGLSQFVFPYHYYAFALGTPYLVAFMAARNFLVLATAVFALLPPSVSEKVVAPSMA